ncbi:hypothetical protein IG631_07480 [Alternaria alternata]|nr:hypothetical protein IG631_07480 [Alternaria alternata]
MTQGVTRVSGFVRSDETSCLLVARVWRAFPRFIARSPNSRLRYSGRAGLLQAPPRPPASGTPSNPASEAAIIKPKHCSPSTHMPAVA